jgi:protein-disulfide isomerase/uncharacterized membrane protein
MQAALRIALTVLAALAVVAAIVLGLQGSTTGLLIAGIGAGWLICAALMAWDLGWGLALAMVAGMGASLYLANQHLAVLCGETSICSVNETFDCDKVNTSSYSELFGIPVALYGLGFYFAIAYATVMRRLGRAKLGGFPRVLLVAGVGAVAYSALLAWVSHSMGTWCLFCISMYGVNLMMLAAAVLALRQPELLQPASPAPEAPFASTLMGMGGDRTVPVMLVSGLVAFVLSIAIYNGKKQNLDCGGATEDLSVLATYYHLPPKGTVELSGTEPQLGSSSAPYLIVEWADYACPWCAKAGAGAKELVKEDPSIQLRFKHYPLSNKCNAFVGSDMHPTACEAARATECARQLGRFWELNDLLFKNQAYQSSEDIRFMAKQIGLDLEALETCMADPVTAQRVETDIAQADKLDISGTPTFFIRGLFGERWVQVRSRPEAMKALIEAHKAGLELPEPGPAPEREH